MKRIILFILLILACSSTFVFADIDYLYFGTTGGFSSISNTPSFGFNTAYQYMAALGNNTYFGLNSHADFSFQFASEDTDISTGAMVGPSLGFAFNPSNFLVFTVAPALYVETGKADYAGFGMGLDVNHTLFLGTAKSFGITFGATSYLMFAEISNKGSRRGFASDIVGYLGFTFRSGDYVGTTQTYYNIY